jgi:predicted permease
LFPFVTDPTPSDNDVVAGWGAFGVFALLILAVVFLGWSLVRQFRKVNAAREAGVFAESKPRERHTIPMESDVDESEKSQD